MSASPLLPSRCTNDDVRWMRYAIALAARGVGRTGANPSVGCVIVRDGQLLAASRTADSGRPHAEHQALNVSHATFHGATAYVTLEPCAHEGDTPSCARLLAESGVTRVVVAVQDPDSRTSGKGITLLRDAGIEVRLGVCAAEAKAQLAGFLFRHQHQRPYVTLKLASSLDGKLATCSGESRWITDVRARQMGHWLRAQHDAIMVGSGTWKQDQPRLNCRLDGLERHSPAPVLLDRHGEVTAGHPAFQRQSYVVTLQEHKERLHALLPKHVTIVAVKEQEWSMDSILHALSKHGIMRLMVEGGATLAASLLQDDVVDACWWFAAPMLLGGDARSAIDALGIERISDARAWHIEQRGEIGRDQWIHLVRQRNTG